MTGRPNFSEHRKLKKSTGEHIAAAVEKRLIQFNIAERVDALSYDTTANNTGVHKGAATLLKKKLGRDLMDLPCRHHSLEIYLKSVFELKHAASSAPGVPIFDRFANAWVTLDHKSFESGIEDVISIFTENEVVDITKFCKNQLLKTHSRKDYTEFLELVLVFIGAERYKIRTPGATSHARWMAKAIYSLKIFLFREQFELTSAEIDGLRDICIFLIKLYIKPWYGCTNAIAAPLQDLNFVKDCIKFAQTDAAVSAAVLKKVTNH